MSRSAATLKAVLPAGVVRIARRVRSIPKRVFVGALRVPAARRGLHLLADLRFDPFDPAFRADPYPFYHRLRNQDPVHRSPFGVWVITRYADAMAMLTDARFAHPDYRAEAERASVPSTFRTLRSSSPLTLNPPDHTRVRRMVGAVFTPVVVAEMRPRIQQAVDRLLDRVEPARQMDAIADFAVPLPVEVMSHLFGIPFADGMRCKRLAIDTSTAQDLFPSAADMTRAEAAAGQLAEYFGGLIRECRAQRRPGLISALVQAQEQTGSVDDAELLSSCVLLFSAGHETTARSLGLAIRILISDPKVQEGLQQPALLVNVVEELLRYDPSVQLFARQALEDVSLGGRRIPRGATVFVAVGGVNRDPAQFSDPDRLDFHRPDYYHIGFGHGIHGCMGQGLARMQIQMALETLVRRFPNLRPGPGLPAWGDSIVLRGLDSLPVSW